MKKSFLTIIFGLLCFTAKAQYGTINAILDRLEEKRGINQNLSDVNIDNKKFILIQDFEDHTERRFIVLKGNQVTYVEIFDDKKTGKSTSNVFSGDVIKTRKNMVSVRADRLEGQKIPVAITKTLLLTRQKNILYLVDVNNRERWIDEISLQK